MTLGQLPAKDINPKNASSTYAGAFLMKGNGGRYKDLKQRSVQFQQKQNITMPLISPSGISRDNLKQGSLDQFNTNMDNLGADSKGRNAYFSPQARSSKVQVQKRKFSNQIEGQQKLPSSQQFGNRFGNFLNQTTGPEQPIPQNDDSRNLFSAEVQTSMDGR